MKVFTIICGDPRGRGTSASEMLPVFSVPRRGKQKKKMITRSEIVLCCLPSRDVQPQEVRHVKRLQ